MKNSKHTLAFLTEVKSVLDNASWDFDACDPNANYDGSYRACSYLSTQKFSINVIKSALIDVWEDFRYNLKDYASNHVEAVKLAASMIADRLAFDRVARFQADYRDLRNPNSKKWYINETVTFKL